MRGIVRQAGLHVKGSPIVTIPVFGDQMPSPGSSLLSLDNDTGDDAFRSIPHAEAATRVVHLGVGTPDISGREKLPVA